MIPTLARKHERSVLSVRAARGDQSRSGPNRERLGAFTAAQRSMASIGGGTWASGPPQNVLKAHGAALTAFPGREKPAAVPKMRGSDRRSKCGPPPELPIEGRP
jgi:hypothetical protein